DRRCSSGIPPIPSMSKGQTGSPPRFSDSSPSLRRRPFRRFFCRPVPYERSASKDDKPMLIKRSGIAQQKGEASATESPGSDSGWPTTCSNAGASRGGPKRCCGSCAGNGSSRYRGTSRYGRTSWRVGNGLPGTRQPGAKEPTGRQRESTMGRRGRTAGRGAHAGGEIGRRALVSVLLSSEVVEMNRLQASHSSRPFLASVVISVASVALFVSTVLAQPQPGDSLYRPLTGKERQSQERITARTGPNGFRNVTIPPRNAA